MILAERQLALKRTEALLCLPSTRKPSLPPERMARSSLELKTENALRRLLIQSGLSLPVWVLPALSLLTGIAAALLFSRYLNGYFLPLFFVAGALFPFAWADSRAEARAAEFSSDYPTILLACASSIKVGMTPYMALERSIRLLTKGSLVRKEVERLLDNLQRGVPKEDALATFGANIRQSDLQLFRSAFLLVLDNGGRFAPTLERLAMVSKERSNLISSAIVSTATMRMTANILLAVTPVILLIIAARTDDFWELFINHPTANLIASTGVVMIAVSYAMLRRMSSFRP